VRLLFGKVQGENMTIRIHMKRTDGFGEYRNIYDIKFIEEFHSVWHFSRGLDSLPFTITKGEIVGLPEIVE
jgi:hypothetical protein